MEKSSMKHYLKRLSSNPLLKWSHYNPSKGERSSLASDFLIYNF